MEDVGILQCTVSFDQLTKTGEIQKKSTHKNSTLVLGRNEFKDIILKLDLHKRQLQYRLCDITIHKKFAKEGKATLKLPNQSVQFMLSNCPPDKLIMFLKTLSTKLQCLKMNGVVSERTRLLSSKERVFQEISPLNIKELQTVHQARAKSLESQIFTPKGKSLKRKRPIKLDEEEKENLPEKLPKLLKPHLSTDQAGNVINLNNQKVLNLVALSDEQKHVLEMVKRGHNMFFTGSAGTGKSFLLRRIIGALPPQHTFATASTGVAACHIGGTTLHAFAGIGSGKGTVEQCFQLATRPQVAQNWKKCKHLIIDEISMVDGEFFDKLETIARMVRQNSEPFGGIQLILCGDFLQLPPIARGRQRQFCFQSKAWESCITTNLELKQVKRQNDSRFIRVLQNVRLGRCPREVNELLCSTSNNEIESDGIQATRLCTHKEDVDNINDFQLKNLPTKASCFHACDSEMYLATTLDQLCPVSKMLELKTGAQVMLAKNLDVQNGLVNGARGVVTAFESDARGYPKVKFLCGVETVVKPEKWVFKISGGMFISRKQLPLKLAWAISIHKSQGMSLDCVEMSLSKVFECGQAYVALSRARSLQGLRVTDFESTCVKADKQVLKFYQDLNMTGTVYKQIVSNKSRCDHF